jgi:beta-lactamase class A
MISGTMTPGSPLPRGRAFALACVWMAGLAALFQLPASAAVRLSESGAHAAPAPDLPERLEAIRVNARAKRIAVAFRDHHTGRRFEHGAAAPYHAASTIKVPVMVAVWGAVAGGAFELESPVAIRNRFLSVVDGSPYRIPRESGANAFVHDALGRTLPVAELAHAMITTSSNLATNELLDAVGLEKARAAVDALGIEGLELKRGIGDDKAFAAGISNRVTARALEELFSRLHEGRVISPDACRQMLAVCFEQKYNSGIPAGLPAGARVAHKTGNISTVAHDAGLVHLPDRAPFALAVLTEWDASVTEGRMACVARVTRAVHDALVR